jgi:hypothetical protein
VLAIRHSKKKSRVEETSINVRRLCRKSLLTAHEDGNNGSRIGARFAFRVYPGMRPLTLKVRLGKELD